MNSKFDVLIVGGGIIGLSAALAMAQRHYHVALLDSGSLKVKLEVPNLRVYAINKASQILFKQLGVWAHLDKAQLAPYRKIHVWDGLNAAQLSFNAQQIAASHLGLILEESALKKALLTAIAAEPLISLFPQSSPDILTHREQGVRLACENQSWEGRLLMAADGANSSIRKKLNIKVTSWPYHQEAIVATIQTEQAHEQTAYQVFHPEGPLAFLPLADPHLCSIVWSAQTKRSQQLMSLSEAEFNTELSTAFANRLGAVRLVSARHQYPLQMRHVQDYVSKSCMLLGDAAHTIHPLAGLGLNLGLADLSSWLGYLDNASSLESKKALQAYQRERKYQVWQTILLMEGLNLLFSTSVKPISVARSLGLNVCNQLNPLKRLFIQHASGC